MCRPLCWHPKKYFLVNDTEHIETPRRIRNDGHTGKDIAKYLGITTTRPRQARRAPGRQTISDHGMRM
jgi:hypothetical protein